MARIRYKKGDPNYSMGDQVLDKMERDRDLEHGELDGQTFVDQTPAGKYEQTDKRAAKRLVKQLRKGNNDG